MTRNLLTIKQLADKHSAFSQAALRNYIFKSKPIVTSKGTIPGNGFDACMVRVGRKILIDESAFFSWIDRINGKEAA
ncbi:hypothetical protein [Methylococcus sp. EFPC2]|uniref:hypothetical protein n=1 Tax=Methylococcus sp. EFPC2 TaxID=2812648 RepID=UPI0019687F8C|nr:hypothetical protein [Methylococcus sp. EFPC2]QSA97728.1 hypothetical protein JWZ97_02530 [Methylococcus sp. EFPC2]